MQFRLFFATHILLSSAEVVKSTSKVLARNARCCDVFAGGRRTHSHHDDRHVSLNLYRRARVDQSDCDRRGICGGIRTVGREKPRRIDRVKLGVISLVVLAVAIAARYAFHLAGTWRSIYSVSATLALYLNVFVLVVQLFEKVPALHELAPTSSEPPFLVAQLVVLAAFLALGVLATVRFRRVAAHAA